MVIQRLAKLFGRRLAEGPPALPKAEVRAADVRSRPPAAGTLAIWESELRAIAVETSAWTIETGGDLFGRWQGTPIVFPATKAGPKAQRAMPISG
jgi:hypothetical protein